jgi:hypothetical protein
MLRFRVWPRCSTSGFGLFLLFTFLSAAAGYDHSWIAATLLFIASAALGSRMFYECAVAMHKLTNALEDLTMSIDDYTGNSSETKPIGKQAMAGNSRP